jgi:hypothetical protein
MSEGYSFRDDRFLQAERQEALRVTRATHDLFSQFFSLAETKHLSLRPQKLIDSFIDDFRDILAESSEAGNSRDVAGEISRGLERFFALQSFALCRDVAERLVVFLQETVPFMNERERLAVQVFVVRLFDEEHDPFDHAKRRLFHKTAVQLIDHIHRAEGEEMWEVDEVDTSRERADILRDYQSAVEEASFMGDVYALTGYYSEHDSLSDRRHRACIDGIFARYAGDSGKDSARLFVQALSPWWEPLSGDSLIEKEVLQLEHEGVFLDHAVLAEENVFNLFDSLLCGDEDIPDRPAFFWVQEADFRDILFSLSLFLKNRLPIALQVHESRADQLPYHDPFAESLGCAGRLEERILFYANQLIALAQDRHGDTYRRIITRTVREALYAEGDVQEDFLKRLMARELLSLAEDVGVGVEDYSFLQEPFVRNAVVEALGREVLLGNFGIIDRVAPVFLGERWLFAADVQPLRDTAWTYLLQKTSRALHDSELRVLERQARVFGFSWYGIQETAKKKSPAAASAEAGEF